jgi:hypothetical protein
MPIKLTNGNDANNATAKYLDKSLGGNGSKLVTGTTAVTATSGTYWAVQFITACTPTTLTVVGGTGAYTVTYPAGFILYGNITAITVGAGESYVLYK